MKDLVNGPAAFMEMPSRPLLYHIRLEAPGLVKGHILIHVHTGIIGKDEEILHETLHAIGKLAGSNIIEADKICKAPKNLSMLSEFLKANFNL